MSFSSLSLISNYGTKNYKKKVVVVVVNLYKILYYNFEGGLATDKFNSYSGTITGTALTNTFPKSGSYSLESKSANIAQYVSIPANIPITNNGLSFSLWLHPLVNDSSGDVILLDMNTNNGMFLWNGVNTDNYQWCAGTLFTVSKTVWTHLILTISSTNVTTVYKNGVLVATGTTSGKYPTNLLLAQGKIGRSISSAHKPFTGYIDEFQIYNKILTISDVATIYAQLDRILYYDFEYSNGGTITNAKDQYNNYNINYNNTSTSGILPAALVSNYYTYNGIIGRSGINTTFAYKGTNSLFNGSGTTTLQTNIFLPDFIPITNDGLTISFWVYTLGNSLGSTNMNQRIWNMQTNLHKSAQDYTHRRLYFVNWYGTTNYSLATTTNIGSTSNVLNEVPANKFSFPNNEWHFITITISPADECKLYLDKVLVQNTTFGPSSTTLTAYPVNNYPGGAPSTTNYPGIYPDIGFFSRCSYPASTGYNVYKSELYYYRTDDGRAHHGYLDEYKMLNKIVSSTEMDSLYNNTYL